MSAGSATVTATPPAVTTPSTWRFEAIGTVWEVESSEPLGEGVRALAEATIAGFDAAWSRFRDDSLVSALARGAGIVGAPADTRPMLELYAALDDATSGAVNPLVGDALARLGYDRDYSFRAASPEPAPRHWRELLAWSDDRLALAAPVTIDVGALGKGRLVDLVADVIAPHVRHVVVDAGGDIAVRGTTTRIGLEHPLAPGTAIGVATVRDAALCASATNRRAWGAGLHHVLDARTGVPVRTVMATWALAPTTMLADAAATALFFDGGDRFAFEHDVAWVRMLSDGRVEWSPECPVELCA